MPYLRGIEVSLTTKPDNERIPEYPHPEGTSARLLGDAVDSPARQAVYRKTNPVVSVYIPSIPGTPFAINYSINTVPPAPCKYVFFRLYMNGRSIASWGIDPNVRPKGKVAKSLWAPSGMYYDEVGFEGRNFVFLPGQDHKSVAEDGGLIEIRAFRAKERRARAPRLEEFRYQENYGIAAPSIGLLDQPQDVCFYDWHLLDAKDSPFASFRLHYRSWKKLKELNLIPANELDLLCAASPKALKKMLKADCEVEGSVDERERLSPQSYNSDEAVFHDCKEDPDTGRDRDQSTPHYSLKSPPELFPTASSKFRIPQPSKMLRDGYRESYLQRPLPELPVVEEPGRLSRRSSTGSVVSATPSITPSLRQYVEEGSLNPKEIEVGVARLVQLPPSESGLSVSPDAEPNPTTGEEYSVSDYDTSPKSTGDSFTDEKLSPRRYLPMTGSALERGIAFFSSPKQPRSSQGSDSAAQNVRPLEERSLSKAVWISRTPSPVRRESVYGSARRDCSPRPDREKGKSLFAGLRKRSLSGSPRNLAGIILGRNVSKPGYGENIVQRGIGNWM
ncbi:uncharacterized protein B0T15DRAFT_117377 [Chaetomium strumarium]|uniref:Uncharacterized protein n=1 Tax=Chaetomium strumarium TaxID=1170767 RepID=A0AAJ0GZ11_9PEZI|nr:hypothetical protein B0T15DRAFT_117377 [Chaetomium strumarium]